MGLMDGLEEWKIKYAAGLLCWELWSGIICNLVSGYGNSLA